MPKHPPKAVLIELPIGAFSSDQSIRHSDAELDEMKESILRNGLLQPPVVSDRNGTLAFGRGRVAACARAGLTHVPAILRPDLADPVARLKARHAENAVRKPLTANEAAELIAQLKPIYADEAAKRQKASQAKPGHKAAQGGVKLTPPCPKPPTVRKQLAQATGMSEGTVHKLDSLREAAAQDPAAYGDLVALADRTSIDAAYHELQRRRRHSSAPSPSPSPAGRGKCEGAQAPSPTGRGGGEGANAPPELVVPPIHLPADATPRVAALVGRIRGYAVEASALRQKIVRLLDDAKAAGHPLVEDEIQPLRDAVGGLVRPLGGEVTWL